MRPCATYFNTSRCTAPKHTASEELERLARRQNPPAALAGWRARTAPATLRASFAPRARPARVGRYAPIAPLRGQAGWPCPRSAAGGPSLRFPPPRFAALGLHQTAPAPRPMPASLSGAHRGPAVAAANSPPHIENRWLHGAATQKKESKNAHVDRIGNRGI